MTLYILFATVLVGLSSAHAAFGLQVVLAAVLPAVLAAVVLLYARSHLSIVALVFFVSAIFLAAATLESNDAQSPTRRSPLRSRRSLPNRQERQAAGEKLFQKLGCIGCHRPDATGIGPALAGLFGRPVTDASCGALTVDEEYLREAILNPSATVAAGFAPVMPSFAGKVTDEELQALTAYVKSLSLRVQRQH